MPAKLIEKGRTEKGNASPRSQIRPAYTDNDKSITDIAERIRSRLYISQNGIRYTRRQVQPTQIVRSQTSAFLQLVMTKADLRLVIINLLIRNEGL
jgi:hypothetical protein